MDGSLPGSSVHGIFQARVLEWVAASFSVNPGNPDLNDYKDLVEYCCKVQSTEHCTVIKFHHLEGEKISHVLGHREIWFLTGNYIYS